MANKITFGLIARALPMLSVQCDRCGRHGHYRVDKLIEKYGADSDVGPFQRDLTEDCAQKNDPDTLSVSALRSFLSS